MATFVAGAGRANDSLTKGISYRIKDCSTTRYRPDSFSLLTAPELGNYLYQ
jgi:hypothetical protein